MKKVKDLFENEAFKATGVRKVFFDEESIKWGNEFDVKIYEAIVNSCFFIPFYNYSYLHVEDLWCAKELYRAIKVEEKIQKEVANFCFILPLIDRGSPSAFPACIGKKNAREIKQFRHLISGNKTSSALETFKENIYEIFLINFKILKDEAKFKNLCADIEIPSDTEIKEWIKEQKENDKKNEANHLPVLTKSAE